MSHAEQPQSLNRSLSSEQDYRFAVANASPSIGCGVNRYRVWRKPLPLYGCLSVCLCAVAAALSGEGSRTLSDGMSVRRHSTRAHTHTPIFLFLYRALGPMCLALFSAGSDLRAHFQAHHVGQSVAKTRGNFLFAFFGQGSLPRHLRAPAFRCEGERGAASPGRACLAAPDAHPGQCARGGSGTGAGGRYCERP